MRYGSVCSGIEAATAAWHHMGWEAAFFSEIEKFPRAVLEHHYPEVPLHGDFTTIEQNQYGKIDLLVGGTPCQSFSIAGLRGGLDDERGNLALEFCRLAQRERPRWIVWENVPGVLSSNGGRDFGSILGALEDLGYGLAYRVLDAQYFGVAQRRRRVFVVGYLGDWRCAAAVLFERHSLSGHPAPSREKRQDTAGGPAPGASERGGRGGNGSSVKWPAEVAATLDTDYASKHGQNNQHVNGGCPNFVPDTANAITAPMANSATGHNKDENVFVFDAYNQADTGDVSKTVAARNDQDTASIVAFDTTQITSPHNYSSPKEGDYIVQQSERQEQRTIPTHDVVGTLCAEDSPHGARGLTGLQTMLAGYVQPVELVMPFDTTQITSPHNYSSPKDGDPCHPLAAGAHPPAIAFSSKDYGADATEDCSPTLRAGGHNDSHANAGVPPAVAYAIQERAVSENPNAGPDGAGFRGDGAAYTLEARTVPQAVAYPIDTQNMTEGHNSGGKGFGEEADPSFTLTKGHSHAVAFSIMPMNSGKDYKARETDVAQPLMAGGPVGGNQGGDLVAQPVAFAETADTLCSAYNRNFNGNAPAYNGSLFAKTASAVRRLTPIECERLQGFPDNFTAIPWGKKLANDCPDGPRYKALGNSMAVPVMRWIGERIQLVDDLVSVL